MGEIYVFGYGSLVNAASAGHTEAFPASLVGWRRVWNVGSDTSSHPEREFRDARGRVYEGVVAVLGIEPEPGAVCPGAVFAVGVGAWPGLDRRERNYDRREVTDVVGWPGKPAGCRVFTYVPRPDARRRLLDARNGGREVVVRNSYLALVRVGFGQLSGAVVPAPPFPLRDLSQHVRLTRVRPRDDGLGDDDRSGDGG